jgi:hypothetical protein
MTVIPSGIMTGLVVVYEPCSPRRELSSDSELCFKCNAMHEFCAYPICIRTYIDKPIHSEGYSSNQTKKVLCMTCLNQ